jgi:hypothetical protein
VLLSELTGDALTGGATILSYGLQMSSNSAGEEAHFIDVAGIVSDSLALQHTIYGVEKGKSYASRYRAKNSYGWSTGWSPVTYEVAADPPAAPPAPVSGGATDTSVTIKIFLPFDFGGQSLTSLELWRDLGDRSASPTFILVGSYDRTSFSLQHTLTIGAGDGLELGKVYSFKTRAANPKGSSEFSLPVQVAVASPAARPDPPVADMDHSSAASLYIKWATTPVDPSKSPGGDIIGYQLLMASAETGEDFEVVFDSVNLST